jgi:hypothetical protein
MSRDGCDVANHVNRWKYTFMLQPNQSYQSQNSASSSLSLSGSGSGSGSGSSSGSSLGSGSSGVPSSTSAKKLCQGQMKHFAWNCFIPSSRSSSLVTSKSRSILRPASSPAYYDSARGHACTGICLPACLPAAARRRAAGCLACTGIYGHVWGGSL